MFGILQKCKHLPYCIVFALFVAEPQITKGFLLRPNNDYISDAYRNKYQYVDYFAPRFNDEVRVAEAPGIDADDFGSTQSGFIDYLVLYLGLVRTKTAIPRQEEDGLNHLEKDDAYNFFDPFAVTSFGSARRHYDKKQKRIRMTSLMGRKVK